MKCPGCDKEFLKKMSLGSHKPSCEKWQKIKPIMPKQLSINERKKLPAKCPICEETFKNIYSMSAHKAHCSGANSTKQLNGHRSWSKGKLAFNDERIKTPIPHTEASIFCKGSLIRNPTIKKIFVAEGRGNQCEICEITSWQNKQITFELDHINGVRDDNRRENLRMLCPNCHSQTPTYRNKNNNKKRIRLGQKPNYINTPRGKTLKELGLA